jgi:hypothetical protein
MVVDAVMERGETGDMKLSVDESCVYGDVGGDDIDV